MPQEFCPVIPADSYPTGDIRCFAHLHEMLVNSIVDVVPRGFDVLPRGRMPAECPDVVMTQALLRLHLLLQFPHQPRQQQLGDSWEQCPSSPQIPSEQVSS